MMKTSTAAAVAVILASAVIPPALGDDVTLYQPVPSYTGTEEGISLTGDLTIKPISTAANGQTAYEVQYTPTAVAIINENTTSAVTDFEPTPTTFTLLADATQYDMVYTETFGPAGGDAVVVAEQNCTKLDDGTFVCQARGETRINETSTTSTGVQFASFTAAAVPWYTISGVSTAASTTTSPGPGSSTGGAGSNAAVSAFAVGGSALVLTATSLAFSAALLLV